MRAVIRPIQTNTIQPLESFLGAWLTGIHGKVGIGTGGPIGSTVFCVSVTVREIDIVFGGDVYMGNHCVLPAVWSNGIGARILLSKQSKGFRHTREMPNKLLGYHLHRRYCTTVCMFFQPTVRVTGWVHVVG